MKKYLLLGIITSGIVIFFITEHDSLGKVVYEKNALTPEQHASLPITPKIENTKPDTSIVDITYLMGKFDPAKEKDFVSIPTTYLVAKNTLYLRKETLDGFVKMRTNALKDGITLNIVSATRNFNSQKSIWENKWTGKTIVAGENLKKKYPDGNDRFKKILEFSSVPSTSRHHWGTDMDINSVDPSYFNTVKGKKEYDWLAKNAKDYGFCQPYSAGRKTGYNEEKWHWSYKPLSKNFTNEYKKLISLKDIKGFLGDTYATQNDVINNYVLGINPDCL